MIFAGPSGGHLFPALAFAEIMRRRLPSARLILVTSEKAAAITQSKPFQIFNAIDFLPNFPFPQGISLRTLRFLLQLLRAFSVSSRYLSKENPDLAVGFGSYASFPGMMLAVFRKIPTLIHEQNQVPGKATVWLLPFVRCVAVSFESTLARERIKRREVTGLPLRSDLQMPVSGEIGIKDAAALFKILIVGGSQGARGLNQLILQIFSHLSAGEKSEIVVTHITGKEDFERVTERYKKMQINYQTYPFFEKMNQLYSQADMAITRAGANTLFELARFTVPAIVIPYPYAGAHQADNARSFAQRQAVIFQTEKDILKNPGWLLDQVRILKNDAGRRKQLSQAIEKLATPQAGEKLADLAEKLTAYKHGILSDPLRGQYKARTKDLA